MNVLCSGYSFFWKKVRKKFGNGILMFLSLQPQSGTDVLNKRRRWEGMMCWLTGFYVVQSSSGYCPGRGLKKNFKNFFWKVWSWWKSPYLCSRFPKRSGRSETFWLMCFSSFADEACRSFLLRRFRKKVWKKVRKDLEGICKSIYLCIRFRLVSGAGKREVKRVLKDIERFENKQQVRVREEIQRI